MSGLWITCGYFVSHPWVFAVGLVLTGLREISQYYRPVADFRGGEPYHKKRFTQGPACKVGRGGGGT